MRSGLISLTAPTKVVLPTPNPPATSIFNARAAVSSAEASEFSRPSITSLREWRQRSASVERCRVCVGAWVRVCGVASFIWVCGVAWLPWMCGVASFI